MVYALQQKPFAGTQGHHHIKAPLKQGWHRHRILGWYDEQIFGVAAPHSCPQGLTHCPNHCLRSVLKIMQAQITVSTHGRAGPAPDQQATVSVGTAGFPHYHTAKAARLKLKTKHNTSLHTSSHSGLPRLSVRVDGAAGDNLQPSHPRADKQPHFNAERQALLLWLRSCILSYCIKILTLP